jgi:protease-4
MKDHENITVHSELIFDLINERKRDRRWRNIRFFIGLLLIVGGIVFSSMGGSLTTTSIGIDAKTEKSDYISLVRLEGMIAPDKEFSALQVLPILKDAFSDSQTKGVILDINSGGGTPVQAAIIHDEILKLKKKYHKKVVVVGEDMLASGAYYVAVSADKIYVNANTVTGSIGVIMQGFGMSDVIKKLGINRRIYTAGANKDRLDPFMPESKVDIDKIHTVLDEVHLSFKKAVLAGRLGKLRSDDAVLFSGDFWPGNTALKLGLVDAVGNMTDVMEQEFNVTRFKDFSTSNNVLKTLMGQVGTVLNLPLSDYQAHLLERI